MFSNFQMTFFIHLLSIFTPLFTIINKMYWKVKWNMMHNCLYLIFKQTVLLKICCSRRRSEFSSFLLLLQMQDVTGSWPHPLSVPPQHMISPNSRHVQRYWAPGEASLHPDRQQNQTHFTKSRYFSMGSVFRSDLMNHCSLAHRLHLWVECQWTWYLTNPGLWNPLWTPGVLLDSWKSVYSRISPVLRSEKAGPKALVCSWWFLVEVCCRLL